MTRTSGPIAPEPRVPRRVTAFRDFVLAAPEGQPLA